jgi:hypothetical protein
VYIQKRLSKYKEFISLFIYFFALGERRRSSRREVIREKKIKKRKRGHFFFMCVYGLYGRGRANNGRKKACFSCQLSDWHLILLLRAIVME